VRTFRIVAGVLAIAWAFGLNGQLVKDAESQGVRSVGLQQVASGLTSPLALVEAPDGTGRLFVVDQIGLVRIISRDGQLLPEPFLDVRDRMVSLNSGYDERGLLSMAFHPNFSENKRFFVHYSAPLRTGAPDSWNNTGIISEFVQSAENSAKADPASEKIILQLDQPQANHNGGTIAFGPDGMLYIATGDGGGANDVGVGHAEDWYQANAGGNGQNVTENLLGKILRIDVDANSPYGIPADNPFARGGGKAEIFAYGLRNPYRFSFDKGGNRQLIAGDVGQGLWEEVSVIQNGGNYGWNVKEGAHCFDAANSEAPQIRNCPDTEPGGKPLIDPVLEYRNARNGGMGISVIGGYVYRGSAMPQFAGEYIFGDWSATPRQPNGIIFVAKPAPRGSWEFQQLRISNFPQGKLQEFVVGFGQDSSGEVFVLTSATPGPAGQNGKIYKLVQP
jgi:glucose/arabinose dehydrogenase